MEIRFSSLFFFWGDLSFFFSFFWDALLGRKPLSAEFKDGPLKLLGFRCANLDCTCGVLDKQLEVNSALLR